MHDRCLNNGGSAAVLREARVRYADAVERYFTVTIEDTLGRRSATEYAGVPGRRIKLRDQLGRFRPKAIVR